MKKILCILFTMILLGSLLIIPISAENETYVISAGTYYLNDVLTDFTVLRDHSFFFDFVSYGVSFDEFYFYTSGTYSGLVLRFDSGSIYEYIYRNGVGYISNGSYFREIVISSDVYIENSDFYNWFIENTIRLDSPSAFDLILSIFTAISDWFLSSFCNVIPMFYSGGSFTLLGYIFLLPLAFCVVYAFLNYVIACLLFRR